jgi:hypothetical protein
VEMSWDVLLSDLVAGQDLVLQIDRGNIGVTQVTIYNYTGETPVQVITFNWGGVTTNRNSRPIKIPATDLMKPAP